MFNHSAIFHWALTSWLVLGIWFKSKPYIVTDLRKGTQSKWDCHTQTDKYNKIMNTHREKDKTMLLMGQMTKGTHLI